MVRVDLMIQLCNLHGYRVTAVLLVYIYNIDIIL